MSVPDPKPTVQLTARAEQDIHAILLYTRRTWGERHRTTYRMAIERALHRLEDHSQLGHAQDDLFIGCRSLPVEEHVLYYHQPRPEEVIVLRVLHRRQDPTDKVRP